MVMCRQKAHADHVEQDGEIEGGEFIIIFQFLCCVLGRLLRIITPVSTI